LAPNATVDWFSQNAPAPPPSQDWFASNAPPPTGNAGSAQKPMVTPLPGESFQDTMARAAQMGKQVTPQQIQSSVNVGKQVAPQMGAVAGSMLAPEIAPEAGLLGRASLSGLGAGAGTAAGQAISGQNPLTWDKASEDAINAALFGGTDLAAGSLSKLAGAKLGRSFINESLQASGRDVIYGNPAKALLGEGIITPVTGDIEAAKAGQGFIDAGGRLGQVSQRIQELQPMLQQQLSQSKAAIPVYQALDKPIVDAANEIIANNAMTATEKDAAISQLGDFQKELHGGVSGPTMTAEQANLLKNQIGGRVRWNGANAIGDDVKPAYKAVYSSLRDAVNQVVPQAADLNERLTNLHAAQDDLIKLARNEEVSRGAGALRGNMGVDILGKLESMAGRVLPGAAQGSQIAGQLVKPALPPLGSALNPDVKVENFPQ
jgi:hypothetical protein